MTARWFMCAASGTARKKPVPSARTSSSCSARQHRLDDIRHSGARVLPDARVRRPLYHFGPALPCHRRPEVLRARPKSATPSPISRSPPNPTTTLPSSASSINPSAASAMPRCRRSTAMPAARVSRFTGRPRTWSRPTRLPGKARNSLTMLLQSFGRWRALIDGISHIELAEMVLDESGYTEMWQNDRSPEAPGRLDNLRELVRSMEEFRNIWPVSLSTSRWSWTPTPPRPTTRST